MLKFVENVEASTSTKDKRAIIRQSDTDMQTNQIINLNKLCQTDPIKKVEPEKIIVKEPEIV